MNHPKVFIIILNWNGLEDTLECLGSVLKLAYPNFEVIVVDNGSMDNSVEVIRSTYPQVTLIENKENLGYTGGNNIAMRYAMDHGADYMWLLNNDTIVEPDTLSKIVDTAESDPKIGLVSPVIYYYGEPDKIQFCGSYVDYDNFSIRHAESIESWREMNTRQIVSLWGTALLVKSNAVKKIGYLNEKYFAYHEDGEYSIRAFKAGYRNIVQQEARVYHKDSRSTGSSRAPMQVFLRVRNLYFLWMDSLNGLRKVRYFRRFLANIISYTAALRSEHLVEAADACLDGAWAGIRGIGGPWDRATKMPRVLKKTFYFLCSWHPYFWASLLRGEFLNIFSEARKRVKLRLVNFYTNR
jgi:hypothetical protein